VWQRRRWTLTLERPAGELRLNSTTHRCSGAHGKPFFHLPSSFFRAMFAQCLVCVCTRQPRGCWRLLCARRRKWSLPTLAHDTSYVPAAEAGPAPWEPEAQQQAQQQVQQQTAQQHTAQQLALEPAPFEMVEFWPYWLDTWAHATVHNTLNLEVGSVLPACQPASSACFICLPVCSLAAGTAPSLQPQPAWLQAP
jgi:hypothetical protein